MDLKVKMQLNALTEVTAVFSGDDFQDAIRNAGVMFDFDGVCGMCKGKNITLSTRVTKDGLKFTEYKCLDCGGNRRWGKFKDNSGYFLKAWEPKYQASDTPPTE
jgi:hypothetical protein